MTSMFSGSIVVGICGGLFALALGGIGILLLVQYLRNKQKAQASTTWPSVEGRITEHKIRMDENDDEDGSAVRYVPEVHFDYTVDGILYQDKRISFGSEPSFSSRKKAEGFLESYQVGSAVSVYYNSEKPQEAVLSQTMRKMTASLIVGIVLIVLGICSLFPLVIGLINALSL